MAKTTEIDNIIQEENITTPIETKTEVCKVLYVTEHTMGILFKDYGIEILTNGILDKSLIKDCMNITYTSDIGFSDFTYQVSYE